MGNEVPTTNPASAPENTSSDNVPSTRSRHVLQDFVLIWLDANIDESLPDFQNSLTHLRRIISLVEIYVDAEKCIPLIKKIKDHRVLIIISGSLGQNVVPIIEKWPQIDSIYIFCDNVAIHKEWSANFSVVKGVYNDVEVICDAVRMDCYRCDQNMISMSFQDIDPLFNYTQLIKEAMLQIEDNDAKCIKKLVDFCRSQNRIPESEIQLVENEYHLHKPIWWYTAHSLMYSTLNRALRVFDISMLLKIGFFMRQLQRHIETLYDEQQQTGLSSKAACKGQFEVFRGQGVSKRKFEKLNQTKGRFMSFNNFLSTGYDEETQLKDFARPAAFITDFVGILFVITIDVSLCKQANIRFVEVAGDIGHFPDKLEILFSAYTIFKIEEIQPLPDPETDRLYKVNLTIANPNSHKLDEFAKTIRKNLSHIKGLPRLAHLLLQAGKFSQAKTLFHILLEKASSEESKADYNYQLGIIYNNEKEYAKAIMHYEQYYKINKATLSNGDPVFVKYYNSLGETYRNMENYSKALECFKESLEIAKRIPSIDRSVLVTIYNNIGIVYDGMNEYPKALSSYQQSLDVQKEVSPSNPSVLAATYSGMGLVYKHMGKHWKALISYQQSLEIKKRSLSSNHSSLASTHNDIGSIYEDMGDHQKALPSYQQALQTLKQAVPTNYSELAASYKNVGRTCSYMEDYTNALNYYQQALEVQKKVYSPDGLDLAEIYKNIGSMYCNLEQYAKALKYHEKDIEIKKNTLPSDHPSLASSYQGIGMVYDKMGQYAKALSFYQEALKIKKQNYPPNHVKLASSYFNIGTVHEHTQEYAKALSSYESALRIWQESLPPSHPSIALVSKNIACIKQKS